jgi:hypothetical protein
LAFSIASNILTKKKERYNFVLKKSKERGQRKISQEKKLNKHLSFANRRCITEDKERQHKMIN